MPCTKMTLRFDLDRPEDRQAWEYLQRLNPVSMNRAVLRANFSLIEGEEEFIPYPSEQKRHRTDRGIER